MFYNFFYVFLIFLIYSIIGYLIEIIAVSHIEKKITFNRGFLIGPYLPIYGTGSLIMIYFLKSYKNDLLVLFIMSTVFCSLLEYLTSLFLEKIFKLRWWDYSDKKFNVDGRICLTNGILFGLLGVLVIKIVNPIIKNFLLIIPKWGIITLGIILSIIFITDLIVTIYIMTNLKINVNKYLNKDATKEIRQEIQNILHKNNYLTTRLLKSFPHLNTLNNKGFLKFKEALLQAKEEMQKLKQEYQNKHDK